MFWSSKTEARIEAIARVVGGSAVYISDRPGEHDYDLLKSLCTEDGRVLRPLDSGRPPLDCLMSDPLHDGTVLKPVSYTHLDVYKRQLLPYGTGTVLQVFWDGISRQAELELSGDLTPQAAVGDLLANRSKAARLVFEDNTAENIRGRALLVQTRHAVVRDNRFVHCTGQGVHVDTATGWMEALGTRDIRLSLIHIFTGRD